MNKLFFLESFLQHFLTKDEKLSSLKSIVFLTGFIGMVILLLPQGFENFEIAGVFGKRLKEYNPILNVFGMLSASSILGIFLLNEEFTVNMLVGTEIVFISLWLINKDKK